jgi:phosphatidylinositol alpha-mannosyltransferase
LDFLVRAFARVKAQVPDARLIIVGAGKFDAQRRLARSLRLRDVEFCSYVSHDDLPRYHQTADVFCSPATGFESQGIVLLEAMAAGLPIVASNIEGYASVLTHGVEGLLVLPEDVEGLADALIRLLNDPVQRRQMAQRGRKRAQEFSWERVSQQVLSYYERLRHERDLAGARSEPARVG